MKDSWFTAALIAFLLGAAAAFWVCSPVKSGSEPEAPERFITEKVGNFRGLEIYEVIDDGMGKMYLIFRDERSGSVSVVREN